MQANYLMNSQTGGFVAPPYGFSTSPWPSGQMTMAQNAPMTGFGAPWMSGASLASGANAFYGPSGGLSPFGGGTFAGGAGGRVSARAYNPLSDADLFESTYGVRPSTAAEIALLRPATSTGRQIQTTALQGRPLTTDQYRTLLGLPAAAQAPAQTGAVASATAPRTITFNPQTGLPVVSINAFGLDTQESDPGFMLDAIEAYVANPQGADPALRSQVYFSQPFQLAASGQSANAFYSLVSMGMDPDRAYELVRSVIGPNRGNAVNWLRTGVWPTATQAPVTTQRPTTTSTPPTTTSSGLVASPSTTAQALDANGNVVTFDLSTPSGRAAAAAANAAGRPTPSFATQNAEHQAAITRHAAGVLGTTQPGQTMSVAGRLATGFAAGTFSPFWTVQEMVRQGVPREVAEQTVRLAGRDPADQSMARPATATPLSGLPGLPPAPPAGFGSVQDLVVNVLGAVGLSPTAQTYNNLVTRASGLMAQGRTPDEIRLAVQADIEVLRQQPGGGGLGTPVGTPQQNPAYWSVVGTPTTNPAYWGSLPGAAGPTAPRAKPGRLSPTMDAVIGTPGAPGIEGVAGSDVDYRNTPGPWLPGGPAESSVARGTPGAPGAPGIAAGDEGTAPDMTRLSASARADELRVAAQRVLNVNYQGRRVADIMVQGFQSGELTPDHAVETMVKGGVPEQIARTAAAEAINHILTVVGGSVRSLIA